MTSIDHAQLEAELERLRAENAELRAWCAYLEKSAASTANGFSTGIRAWAEALADMSPLRRDDEAARKTRNEAFDLMGV